MNHSELVTALAKPGADILATLTPKRVHLLHMAMGITGETGEFIEVGLQELEGEISADESVKLLKKELGDLEFYLEGMYQGLDITETITDVDPEFRFDPVSDLVMAANGVLETTKKLVMYDRTGQEHTVEKAVRQVSIALLKIYDHFEFDRDEVKQINCDKLTERYGKTYSDKAANERVDVK